MKKRQGLTRGLKSRHVELMALGGAIGTGLFLGAGQSIHFAGPSLILAYLVAGLAFFFLMRALGELLMSDPDCGSYIKFVGKYLGHRTGFVAGWVYWFCWITMAMADVTATGLYMRFWFPQLPAWVTGLIVLAILFLINSSDVSIFGEAEFWFALIKIVAIVVLIITGIVLVSLNVKTNAGHATPMNLVNHGFFAHGLRGFVLSFQMLTFSFTGIEMIGMTASETQNPTRELPKCINSVPTRILLFYVGSLLALMCIYPWNRIAATSSPFVQVFSSLGIRSAAAIINFVVLTAALSSCNSGIYTTSRMVFSMDQGQTKLGRFFKKLSQHHVPLRAVVLSIIGIAAAIPLNLVISHGAFVLITGMSTTCFLLIWILIILTHLRYRSVYHRKSLGHFRMPWYPFSDYYTLAFMLFVMVVLLFQKNTLTALVYSLILFALLYTGKAVADRLESKKVS